MFAGSSVLVRGAESIIRTLRSGEAETPKTGKSAISIGLKLEIDLHRGVSISQNRYIGAMNKINPTKYAEHGVIGNKNDLRATIRKALGAIIRARPTLPVL